MLTFDGSGSGSTIVVDKVSDCASALVGLAIHSTGSGVTVLQGTNNSSGGTNVNW